MKKILFFLLVIHGFVLHAQTETYYYYDDHVELQLIRTHISVKFLPDLGTAEKYNCLARYGEWIDVSSFDERMEVAGFYGLRLRQAINPDRMEVLVSQLKAEPEIMFANPGYTPAQGQYVSATDRVTFRPRSDISVYDIADYLQDEFISDIAANEFDQSIYHLTLSDRSSLSPFALSRRLHDAGLVEFAEPELIGYDLRISNDPLYSTQWGHENTGQHSGTPDADVDANDAWTVTSGRPDVIVAVVDEGTDLSHPDLAAHLVPGFDASGNGTAGACTGNDAHGTACAGIIGAIRDNNIGIAGVAPECSIMPVRVMINGNGTSTWFGDGLNWAWQHGADILSNSWYFPSPTAYITNAINGATSNGRGGLGSVVLFAAGNFNSSVTYPGNLPNVIGVGAMSMCNERKRSSSNSSEVNSGVSTDPAGVSCDGEKWWGSCFGAELDIMAPGVKIATTDISGTAGYDGGDYTPDFNGTSSATPYAAGVAALVLSVNRCLSYLDVAKVLALSCEKVGNYCYSTNSGNPYAPWNNQMGYGRVNAYNAVRIANSTQIANGLNISGADQGGVGIMQWSLISGGCSALAAANYFVYRHEVSTTVSYPYIDAPTLTAWSNGFSAASPNNGNYYCGISNVTNTSAKLTTYVYEVVNTLGQFIGWVPTAPANVRFNYTAYSFVNPNQYFQNQNVFTTQVHHVRHVIYAGEQVTTAVGYGAYTVKSGADVTFRAGREINLEYGFNVEYGGTFWGYIQPFFTCTQYPNGIMVNNPSGMVPFHVEERTAPITEDAPAGDEFSIYPNPFRESVNLEYTAAEQRNNVAIAIYDVSGNKVYEMSNQLTIPPGKYQLQLTGLSHLAQGIYFVRIRSEGITHTQRIVKVNY